MLAKYLSATSTILLCVGQFNARGTDSYASVLSEQLNQYCHWHLGLGNQSSDGIISRKIYGKSGPKGPRGPPGSDGQVNYTRVDDMVKQVLADLNYEGQISALASQVKELRDEIRQITRTDCSDVVESDAKMMKGNGGVYDIYPSGYGNQIEVFCDLKTDGGGWIVFQRRQDGSENFERDYADYVKGFGSVDEEFWLGLEKLHVLTSKGDYELRADLTDWENNTGYAYYLHFSVDASSSQYSLSVSGYSGTVGDSMAYHNGHKFYTRDQDNGDSCGRNYRGGWWYNSCYYSNLNGIYLEGGSYSYTHPYGIEWYHWKGAHGYSLKSVELKIRQKS